MNLQNYEEGTLTVVNTDDVVMSIVIYSAKFILNDGLVQLDVGKHRLSGRLCNNAH